MHVYDIDIMTDSDEGRTFSAWTAQAHNMADAVQDALQRNKVMLSGKTDGAVMVTVTKKFSKQAEKANFEAKAIVEHIAPEMVHLMTVESAVSLDELFKPPVKH